MHSFRMKDCTTFPGIAISVTIATGGWGPGPVIAALDVRFVHVSRHGEHQRKGYSSDRAC